MPRSRRNVPFATLLLIVLAAFAASSFLFVAQGGVGAGHMRFDQVIGILGLPWLWVLELIPWPESLWLGDYVMIVLLPLVCNLAVVLVLWALLKRRR
jgi:hypothetical protein